MRQAPPGGGSRLSAFVVVVVLLFLLAVMLVVAIPTLSGTHHAVEQADHGQLKKTGLEDNMNFVMDVGLLWGPTIVGIGIVAYLYAVVSGKGSFRGRR